MSAVIASAASGVSASVASDQKRRAGVRLEGVDSRRSGLRRARLRCFLELNESEARSYSDLRADKFLDAFGTRHPQPDRSRIRRGLDLKSEERAASPLEGHPLRDFQQRNCFRRHPEGVAVVEL